MLQGSVRRSGTKLRITAQLVNASDGMAVWGETYERAEADIFAIQDDIARAIVNALQLKCVCPLFAIRRSLLSH